MWYVIMKLVANCKDDVQLMVNFKAVVLFIRILICYISHRTFGNERSLCASMGCQTENSREYSNFEVFDDVISSHIEPKLPMISNAIIWVAPWKISWDLVVIYTHGTNSGPCVVIICLFI